MAIESLGGLSASNAPLQVNSLGLEDFMKILVAQLTYQDPMKPMDNQQFISQLAQFTSLQQATESNARLQQLLTVQSATQAISLLGRTVEVQAEDGGSTVGLVSTLRFSEGQPLVTLQAGNGAFLTDVPLSRIALVR